METLTNLGFTKEQSAVYTTLLEYGKLPASAIASKSKVSRVITYNILNYFVDSGLVEKIDIPKSIALFRVTDPENLRRLVETKKAQIQTLEASCESAISQLRPRFNLLTNKPGVTFYEGIEGVKKVLEDTLYTEGVIYTYLDMTSVVTHLKEVNAEYVKRRERAGIKKKLLAANTKDVKDLFNDQHKDYSDVRIVGEAIESFGSAMQIYDDKVAYTTFAADSESIISILIQDKKINEMHRYFFDALFNSSKPI